MARAKAKVVSRIEELGDQVRLQTRIEAFEYIERMLVAHRAIVFEDTIRTVGVEDALAIVRSAAEVARRSLKKPLPPPPASHLADSGEG